MVHNSFGARELGLCVLVMAGKCVFRQSGGTRLEPQPPWPGVRAFTLIELLVVVAIISLLVSMLLPTLARAKVLAKRSTCMNNFKSLGVAVAYYQSDYGEYVPICWQNLDSSYAIPWKSWRSNLLPYVPYRMFNCPMATPREMFTSDDDVTGQGRTSTGNAGSSGVMYQFSLPSFQSPTSYGDIDQGHPCWSLAFSTVPGRAWRDPPNSVYIADAYFTKSDASYPSMPYATGTSAIVAPDDTSFGLPIKRRFADRHAGTNCLFLNGCVTSYKTQELDQMTTGSLTCVWDVE